MVSALEAENGFPLLKRGRRGGEPTPECERMLRGIRELIRAAEALRQTSVQICGLETGDITVGTAYSVYYRWLCKIIADYTRIYSGTDVHIVEGTSSELSVMLEEGGLDFCIISKRDGHFLWVPLREVMYNRDSAEATNAAIVFFFFHT